MIDEAYINGLCELADSDRAKQLTAQLILCESLRNWLETSKEGKLLHNYLISHYADALTAFEECDLNDTNAMVESKMNITACKKVYNIFNQVFHDANSAESELTNSEQED